MKGDSVLMPWMCFRWPLNDVTGGSCDIIIPNIHITERNGLKQQSGLKVKGKKSVC